MGEVPVPPVQYRRPFGDGVRVAEACGGFARSSEVSRESTTHDRPFYRSGRFLSVPDQSYSGLFQGYLVWLSSIHPSNFVAPEHRSMRSKVAIRALIGYEGC